jgi:hypothetical protein
VPLSIRYGMTCLLIRDVLGSVPCSDEWEGVVVPRTTLGNLSIAMVLQLPKQSLAYDP